MTLSKKVAPFYNLNSVSDVSNSQPLLIARPMSLSRSPQKSYNIAGAGQGKRSTSMKLIV